MMVTTFGAPKHTAPPSPAQGVFVRYLLRYSAPRRAVALVIRQPSVRGRWLNSSRSGFLKLVYDPTVGSCATPRSVASLYPPSICRRTVRVLLQHERSPMSWYCR